MHDKSAPELEKLLADTRAALREERFAAAGARAKDPAKTAQLRKVVARTLTEMRSRTLNA